MEEVRGDGGQGEGGQRVNSVLHVHSQKVAHTLRDAITVSGHHHLATDSSLNGCTPIHVNQVQRIE